MFHSAVAVVGLAASLLLAPVSGSDGDIPGDRIPVDVVTVNGSGCPPGSAAVAVAPDNSAFTVTYSQYLAQVGGGISATERRKNCQLALNFHVPSGFTFAIDRTDHRGYAYLASGSTALAQSTYYFQGQVGNATATHTFSGPLDDNWQASDAAPLVFRPCDAPRYLNVNTELRVNAGSSPASATSFMTMDSTDGTASSIYHFTWKRC